MRTGIVAFAILILALGLTGVAYAHWSETVYISGTVETGFLDVAIEAGDSWDTEPEEKDVSYIHCWVEDGGQHTLQVEIVNGYPNIDYYQEFTITNTGTIPVHTYQYFTNPYPDLLNIVITGVHSLQVHPGETVSGLIHVNVAQEASQNAIYQFNVEILASQWNVLPEEPPGPIKFATALSVSPPNFTLESDGTQILTATLTSGGSPLADETITWSATLGSFDSSSGITDSSGEVTVTYTAPTVSHSTSVTITASFAGDVTYMSSSGSSFGTITETITKGLVGYWTFDEGSGTRANDSSGNGNNGTIYGASWTDDAVSGKALDFDGVDDVVSMGDVLGFERTDSWTISAWIKTSDSHHGAVVSKIGAGARGYDLFVIGGGYGPPGDLAVHIIHAWGGDAIRKYSDMRVDNGSWYHVAYTYDGSSSATGVNIYIDGVLHNGIATHTSVSNSITNPSSFRIGGREGVQLFRGLIDEARIYNRVLSPTEIEVISRISITSLSVSPPVFFLMPGVSQDLTAKLIAGGNPLENKTITWSATSGSLSSSSGTTNSAGQVMTTYTAPDVSVPTFVTVTASFAGDAAYEPSYVISSGVIEPLMENLVGYWRFDEGSGSITADDSGNGNEGIVYGASWTDDAVSGKALDFDGVDDVVSMGDVLGFERTDSWTISAWIKTSDSHHGAVVSKIGAGIRGYDLFVVGGGYNPHGYLVVHIANNWDAGDTIRKYSDVSVDDGAWHHVVYTYDGSSSAAGVNIYVDGALHNGAATHTTVSNPITNSSPFRIGGREGMQLFRGLIDEVRVYNRELNPEEVAALNMFV